MNLQVLTLRSGSPWTQPEWNSILKIIINCTCIFLDGRSARQYSREVFHTSHLIKEDISFFESKTASFCEHRKPPTGPVDASVQYILMNMSYPFFLENLADLSVTGMAVSSGSYQ